MRTRMKVMGNIEKRRRFRQVRRVKMKFPFTLLCALALLASCSKSVPPTPVAPPPLANSEPTHAQPKLRTMKLYLGAETLDVELALSFDEIRCGMMFRTNIKETDAMIFNLRYPQQANFWMKNCPESISVAYLTADGVIQEIHHLEQNDTNGVAAARNDILFALETKEGWFTRHNVGPGTLIRTEKGSLQETFLK